jgi:hypothetical protein
MDKYEWLEHDIAEKSNITYKPVEKVNIIYGCIIIIMYLILFILFLLFTLVWKI